MNPFEMVVLIVAIVMAAVVMKARYRSLGDTAGADPAAREDTARLQSELRALKERVATLERIATDGASALDREIEALRERH